MKKKNLWIVAAAVLAIVLTGCNATMSRTYRFSPAGSSMVETNSPIPMDRQVERGVTLSLGRKTYMNIDIECILEYMQGESDPIENQPIIQNDRYPWIRFSMDF